MLNSVNGVRAERRGRREDKQGHRREEGGSRGWEITLTRGQRKPSLQYTDMMTKTKNRSNKKGPMEGVNLSHQH